MSCAASSRRPARRSRSGATPEPGMPSSTTRVPTHIGRKRPPMHGPWRSGSCAGTWASRAEKNLAVAGSVGQMALQPKGGSGDARDMSTRPPSRHVVLVAYPGVNALDVIGPLEVFSAAAKISPCGPGETPAYTTEVVARVAGALRTQSGIGLIADRALAAVRGGIDTLLVAGGLGT